MGQRRVETVAAHRGRNPTALSLRSTRRNAWVRSMPTAVNASAADLHDPARTKQVGVWVKMIEDRCGPIPPAKNTDRILLDLLGWQSDNANVGGLGDRSASSRPQPRCHACLRAPKSVDITHSVPIVRR